MRGSEGLPLRPVSRSSAGEPATLYGWWSGPSMIHRIHQQTPNPGFLPPRDPSFGLLALAGWRLPHSISHSFFLSTFYFLIQVAGSWEMGLLSLLLSICKIIIALCSRRLTITISSLTSYTLQYAYYIMHERGVNRFPGFYTR